MGLNDLERMIVKITWTASQRVIMESGRSANRYSQHSDSSTNNEMATNILIKSMIELNVVKYDLTPLDVNLRIASMPRTTINTSSMLVKTGPRLASSLSSVKNFGLKLIKVMNCSLGLCLSIHIPMPQWPQ